jgi:hypothetical protein
MAQEFSFLALLLRRLSFSDTNSMESSQASFKACQLEVIMIKWSVDCFDAGLSTIFNEALITSSTDCTNLKTDFYYNT